MLRGLLSFLTWTSAFFLLLTAFLLFHSIGRYDLWSWNTADSSEYPSSSASLGVGRARFAFNIWIHVDDGQLLCTTLEHTAYASEAKPLPDGLSVSSRAGFTIAKGSRVHPETVSYLGVLFPAWLPLLLFAPLPIYAVIRSIRRRLPLRIMSRARTAISLASFAFAIFLTVMWIKSYDYDHVAVPDRFFFENYGYFLSSRGITYWYFFDTPLHLRQPMWWRFPSGQSASKLAVTMDPAVRFLGFGRVKTTYFHQSLFLRPSTSHPLTILAVPYYALLAMALILPATTVVAGMRAIQRRRRGRKGQCPQCGYDLRATPDLCPECGYISTPSSPTAPIAAATNSGPDSFPSQ